MSEAFELAILSQQRPRVAELKVGGCAAHCYADYSEFHQSSTSPAAFIIKSDDAAYTGLTLRQLRHDPDHGTALAFIDGAAGELEQAASDGPLPRAAQALVERIAQSRSRAHAIRVKNDNRSPDALLLEYMWLRPDYVLEPLADWRHVRRYHYPALELLDRGDSDPDTWLQRLAKRNLIETVALRDRQRECDHCGSAHLNFIDVCPSCRGIDVGQHAALHCFTCGLIAPEDRYIRGDQRQCPKCGTRLRHIGTDYDRPLETNLCGSCDHVFVEGDVEARCAVCNKSSATTRLRQRKIHSWRLSGLGCLAAQGDAPGQLQTMFEPRQYVPYPHFLGSVDWSLKLALDSSSFGFALAGLHLENLAELNRSLGVGRTADLLEGCADRLREAMGEADLATRADQQTIYLLLPNADRRRLSALHHTMRDLVVKATQENGLGPSWRMAEHIVSHKSAKAEDARGLIQKLRAGLLDARQVA